jgi:hypothetical protein
MAFHIAPLIREMENARVSVGLLSSPNSTGYTQRVAQEGVTQPTPLVTPNGGIGNFWFANQKTAPAL